MRLPCAARAIPPPAPIPLHLVERRRPRMIAGIVVPAHRLELPDGGDARHDRQVPLAADLGARCPTGVAGHPHVCGLDQLESHVASRYGAGNTSVSTAVSASRAFFGRPRGRGAGCGSEESTSPSAARDRRVERGKLTPSSWLLKASSPSA